MRQSGLFLLLVLMASMFSCQKREPDTIAVEAVTVSQSTAEMVIGDHIQLKAFITPSNATEQEITWASSNQHVATVSETGYVEALAKGTSNISALVGGLTATCRVTVSEVSIETLVLNKSSLQLYIGQTDTIVATIKPDYTTDKTVLWLSSDPTVATVEDGIVTGLKVGETKITAKSGDVTAECTVTVGIPLVESVSMDKNAIELLAGTQEELKIIIFPESANSRVIEWWSENPEIASISYNDMYGTVMANNEGETIIYAIAIAVDNDGNLLQDYDEKLIASCRVKVKEIPAESITLNQTALFLKPGDTFQLTATVYPNNVTNRTITWNSSNPSVIDISQDGLVTAIDAGTATVSVYCGGITVYCEITVSDTDGLCLEAIETGNVEIKNPLNRTIQYSYDGILWESDSRSAFSLALNAGETMYLRGNSDSYSMEGSYANINCHGKCYIYGNIMSLISKDYRTLNGLYSSFAFAGLFSLNVNLINHPTKELLLPATTLSYKCYSQMFLGCSGLTKAPSLPSTELSERCYQWMFSGCSNLKTTPSLPATQLAESCYSYMFENCTSISEMPELPARTLSESCYQGMFLTCTSLSQVHELPALTLSQYCYENMFWGCTSLEAAPTLPATTLAPYCYSGMFKHCTALEKAPTLPATTLSNNCYKQMFWGCTSLEAAPTLPATTLAVYCYDQMFRECTNLEIAPSLPATALAEYCYRGMFIDCITLEKAPQLPAVNAIRGCYVEMFYNCSNLKLVDVSFSTKPYSSGSLEVYTVMGGRWCSYQYTYNWLQGVSQGGTIYISFKNTCTMQGESWIPYGWEVKYVE